MIVNLGRRFAHDIEACAPRLGLGGFSSHDASFGFWPDKNVELVAIVFMSLAAISFARYFIVWRSRSLWSLLHSAVSLTGLLMRHDTFDKLPEAALSVVFHVVSLATTTGYAATDYAIWPVFAPIWLMFLGAFVSSAGSTGGGIKMVRIMVRAIHPRIVNPVTMGRTTIPASVIASVMPYMLIDGATMLGLTTLMLLSGLDLVTAFSAVVATVNNIDPGLGQVGPSTNFGILSDFQTWVGTLGMLMGRLELLAVMVLFVPEFWRK